MKKHSKKEERALLGRAKQGDQKSFEELESACRTQVMCSVIKYTRNEDRAEEIYQKGIIKAWKKIKKFKGDCRFSTWLYRICHNLSCDEYRYRKRKNESSFDSFREDYPDLADAVISGEQTEDDFNKALKNIKIKELGQKLDEVLNSLPEDHSKTLKMHILDEMSYKQIAKKMRCPVGTVMSRLYYARKNAKVVYNRITSREKRYEERHKESLRSQEAVK